MSNAKSAIASHIASLREQKANEPEKADDAIIFWGTAADKKFLPYLKGCVGGVTTYLNLSEVKTRGQVQLFAKNKKVDRIISSSPSLLRLLLDWDKRAAPSLANYAGSYFTIPTIDDTGDIEIVFISPLAQLVTVPYGKFMATRQIKKLTKPEQWYKETDFDWCILTASNEEERYAVFQQATLIAVDIETFKENATIRCLSYTAFIFTLGKIESYSVVLPLDSEYNLSLMRKWNNLPAPKVMQGGMYDAAYFARYSAPLHNYLFDTANLFHSWYSELPKDLGFLNSFFIRKAKYWKDLSETNDLHEYYRYNALDTWGTGNAFLAMVMEAPAYAINNYLLEFPLVFPCHYCEMRGIERDMDALDTALKVEQEKVAENERSLNYILDMPPGHSFNTNSPPQVKSLLGILGCKDLTSTDEKTLNKAKFRHPLNARLLNLVIANRKARKLISTYLTPGKEFHRLDGTGNRILFALKPHGTDSSRQASSEHHFWCGLQIQNIPRGPEVKQTLKADPGFKLYEVDLEQAESRDTAYIAADLKLIDNVENAPDFHRRNASLFFGFPEDEISKEIRQIGKNVNHGANYNMGEYVLILTMTEEKVQQAKELLQLPRMWTLKQVAEYLLEECFHKTYPDLRGKYFPSVVEEVMTTSMLTLDTIHYCDDCDGIDLDVFQELQQINPRGWVRYCFGNPEKSRHTRNSYISHKPQALNAQTLNYAFKDVFYNIQMNPQHWDNFRLVTQIHDSILFQARIGHEYLVDMVREKMEIPVTIRGIDDKIRSFTVPADASNPGDYWSELK